MDLASAPPSDGRNVAVTTLAENLRAATSIVHDTVTFRDVRSLRQKVANLRAHTEEIRRFTEDVEKTWPSLPDEQKRELYNLALRTTRSQDRGRAADEPSVLMKALFRAFFGRWRLAVVKDAEDAVFWFADEIFDQVEGEAPEVQAMLGARLESARRDVNLDEQAHVGA